MGNIDRDKAVEAVEEFLHDTFEAPVAMGEEWTADRADDIVELVLEAVNPQGAVERVEKAEAKAAHLEAIIWKHRYAIGSDVPPYMDGMTAT